VLIRRGDDVARELVNIRKREVLTLITQGSDNQGIADRLCISVHTVNYHRQDILWKTRTREIAQAAYHL